MAALSLLRFSKGFSLYKAIGSTLPSRLTPVATCLNTVQQREFISSPVSRGRIYGPPDHASEPSVTGHWKIERVVSILLLPVIPVGLAYPNVACDWILSAALLIHTHWGLNGVSTDYIHGEILPKLFQAVILFFSIIASAGLFYLNFKDVGLGKAVHMVWKKL